MKIFKLLLLSVAVTALFFSCKKNEAAYPAATGSLKADVTGECLPSHVEGIFQATVTLTNSSYIDVTADIKSAGMYDVRTDTINGYSFRGSGRLGFTGLNTIRLYPSGRPIIPGTDVFTVTFDSSGTTTSCQIAVTVIGGSTPPAVCTLKTVGTQCDGAVVEGTYTVGTPLGITNTVAVKIDVTIPGLYALTTKTPVNGMTFTSVGVFASSGVQTVILAGSGTPLAAGIFNLTLGAGSSTCIFSVTVVGGAPAATFTLGGAPGACAGFASAGVYKTGTALNSTNTVTTQAEVTGVVPGSYNITTNTVNGISFTGAGTFTAAGTQNVTLTGSGTPTAAGTFNFTATAGASTCTFSISCTEGTTPPPSGDYFPLSQNSYWTYDYTDPNIGLADTVKYAAEGNSSHAANNYTTFNVYFLGIKSDSTFYRKSGNDYYNWNLTDALTYNFVFDAEEYADILFLKENAATGTTWTAGPYSGTVSGAATNMRYKFEILNANTTLTVGSNNFSNVIKTGYTVEVSTAGGPYTAVESGEMDFAKGVGMIYWKYVISGATTGEYKIRYYNVN